VLWLPRGDVLVAGAFWRSEAVDVEQFESACRGCRLRAGSDLAGRVLRSREPVNAAKVIDDPSFERREAAAAVGLRGAVAFPALFADEVLAVVELFSLDELPLPERLMRSLSGIGYELGQFFAARRGELAPPALTPRELEVLQLAARGHTGREIGARLTVSRATVKTHFEHIYEKLHVSDRAAAVASALRLGVID
jgi:DNA-binding NarL/FixJ family response regulator